MYKSKNATNFVVNVANLPVKGIKDSLVFTGSQLVELAAEHDLLAVNDFAFHYQILRWKVSGVRLKAKLQASIIQECVLSLAPVPYQIDEDIELFFVVDGDNIYKPFIQDETKEIFLDISSDDIPEIYDGHNLEIGKIAEEFFELAIPIYPKAEGAELAGGSWQTPKSGKVVADSNVIPHPFAGLAKLKDKFSDK